VPTKLITQVTRRKIFDTITLSKEFWEGRLEEPDFLARIYDLDAADAPSSRTAGARAAARVGRDQVDVEGRPSGVVTAPRRSPRTSRTNRRHCPHRGGELRGHPRTGSNGNHRRWATSGCDLLPNRHDARNGKRCDLSGMAYVSRPVVALDIDGSSTPMRSKRPIRRWQPACPGT
jgi:hypothetical protein